MATDISEEELLYFNGINGATGEYGLAPMSDKDFAAAITKQGQDSLGSKEFRPMYGIDAKNLAETGWGIIFPSEKDDPERQKRNGALKEALTELIQWRQSQAGQYFKVFDAAGYQPGETKIDFLRKRAGAGAGPVDPSKGVPSATRKIFLTDFSTNWMYSTPLDASTLVMIWRLISGMPPVSCRLKKAACSWGVS